MFFSFFAVWAEDHRGEPSARHLQPFLFFMNATVFLPCLELERSHAVDIGGVSLFLSSSRMVGGFLSSGALLALDAADKCQMFIWM